MRTSFALPARRDLSEDLCPSVTVPSISFWESSHSQQTFARLHDQSEAGGDTLCRLLGFFHRHVDVVEMGWNAEVPKCHREKNKVRSGLPNQNGVSS